MSAKCNKDSSVMFSLGLGLELMNSGAFFDTRQLGPSTRVSKNAPKFTGHQLGP